jgi:hypothetical protein
VWHVLGIREIEDKSVDGRLILKWMLKEMDRWALLVLY